jgi:hypothetical protein
VQEGQQQEQPEIGETCLERRSGRGCIHGGDGSAVSHEQHAPQYRREQRQIAEPGVKDRKDTHF